MGGYDWNRLFGAVVLLPVPILMRGYSMYPAACCDDNICSVPAMIYRLEQLLKSAQA